MLVRVQLPEQLDEAYSLPWWRVFARRRLVRQADRLWQ
jgi:alkylated DNA nucleotide flippase Atl1